MLTQDVPLGFLVGAGNELRQAVPRWLDELCLDLHLNARKDSLDFLVSDFTGAGGQPLHGHLNCPTAGFRPAYQKQLGHSRFKR